LSFAAAAPKSAAIPWLGETMTRLLSPLAAPLLLALAAGLAAGPAAAQNAISPGYWETTSKVTAPFPTKKTERRCIKPHDVTKFMEGKINHIYTCTYPTKHVGDGKIRLDGTCSTRDGPAIPITGEGTFTADTLHLDANNTPRIAGLNIAVKASTDARRIADACPAPEAEPAG
jgi:hypothetical protein